MSGSVAPIKVVFDCMIFLQATANEECPAATALDLLDTGEIKLYLCERILGEVRRVLHRAEVRAALPQMSVEGTQCGAVERLRSIAKLLKQLGSRTKRTPTPH